MSGINNEAPENRKYQRGITPTSMKLPKGVKAITSNKPGETREITFYQLTSEIITPTTTKNNANNQTKSKRAKMSLVLADLPGYGFAYASEETSQQWRELMKEYIINRGKSLKRVLLLLDARHGIKSADVDFLIQLQQDLKKWDRKVR